MDLPSPYNAIIGHTWLAAMKALPSTYRQHLRFPTSEGIMEIRGDQVATRRCYMAALAINPARGTTRGGRNPS
ncbi:hypothetical protein QJS04_geneDACA011525 [Acorus gramineus]|uniref:Uncharacterized protein n=1 Tax=Acorus gramineus TaxID=55184 RepID=A0AAV9ABN5_ACOGR|nr:hypothetical protein QJS04_geneDACA011525 [Acorus gramineus]